MRVQGPVASAACKARVQRNSSNVRVKCTPMEAHQLFDRPHLKTTDATAALVSVGAPSGPRSDGTPFPFPFPRVASLWGAGLVGPGDANTAFWNSCGFPPPGNASSSAATWARYGVLAAFIADSPQPAALMAEWHEFLTNIKALNPATKFVATAPMMQMLTDFIG